MRINYGIATHIGLNPSPGSISTGQIVRDG
jgi:hypothetical protein